MAHRVAGVVVLAPMPQKRFRPAPAPERTWLALGEFLTKLREHSVQRQPSSARSARSSGGTMHQAHSSACGLSSNCRASRRLRNCRDRPNTPAPGPPASQGAARNLGRGGPGRARSVPGAVGRLAPLVGGEDPRGGAVCGASARVGAHRSAVPSVNRGSQAPRASQGEESRREPCRTVARCRRNDDRYLEPIKSPAEIKNKIGTYAAFSAASMSSATSRTASSR